MENVSFFPPKALITDVDGTITDERRRINTDAILAIRTIIDADIPVILASGNTVCSLNMLSKMIGTDGTIIAENGGTYRVTYQGEQKVCGNHKLCWDAYELLNTHFSEIGNELELYSPEDRFADVAFARTVGAGDVRELLKQMPSVKVIDTGFAIHLQLAGITKGSALLKIAEEMNIPASEFLAVGDSENDVEMLENAGIGVSVSNGHQNLLGAADWISKKTYGDGFVETVIKYFPSLF